MNFFVLTFFILAIPRGAGAGVVEASSAGVSSRCEQVLEDSVACDSEQDPGPWSASAFSFEGSEFPTWGYLKSVGMLKYQECDRADARYCIEDHSWVLEAPLPKAPLRYKAARSNDGWNLVISSGCYASCPKEDAASNYTVSSLLGLGLHLGLDFAQENGQPFLVWDSAHVQFQGHGIPREGACMIFIKSVDPNDREQVSRKTCFGFKPDKSEKKLISGDFRQLQELEVLSVLCAAPERGKFTPDMQAINFWYGASDPRTSIKLSYQRSSQAGDLVHYAFRFEPRDGTTEDTPASVRIGRLDGMRWTNRFYTQFRATTLNPLEHPLTDEDRMLIKSAENACAFQAAHPELRRIYSDSVCKYPRSVVPVSR